MNREGKKKRITVQRGKKREKSEGKEKTTRELRKKKQRIHNRRGMEVRTGSKKYNNYKESRRRK